MVMLLIGVLLGAGPLLLGGLLLRRFQWAREVRIVKCPETTKTVAIGLEPRRAMAPEVLGRRRLKVRRCTEWPARMACRQECLSEVERAPDDCRVASILRGWYADKRCAFCRAPLSPIGIATHKPAILSATGETFEWGAIKPETIHEVIATHRPVCWDCHVIETLSRTHRDRPVEGPAGPSREH